MTYQANPINFNTMPVNEPSDEGMDSNSEYDEKDVPSYQHSDEQVMKKDEDMNDHTESDKGSIHSSAKDSLEQRDSGRKRKSGRRVIDSADSEDEKVLFGAPTNYNKNY